MRPSRDPNSDKYPDRVFYGGWWMTPEKVEAERERKRIENMTPEQIEAQRKRDRVENMTPEQIEAHDRARSRRVYVGRYYVGRAPTVEQATALTNQIREEFRDR